MLRDLSKSDWLSILNIPEKRIPKVLILRCTRNLRTQYEYFRGLFENVLELGAPNGILDDVFLGELDDIPIAYASVYGAPMASEQAHVFGVLGTSLVIQTGNFGVLASEGLSLYGQRLAVENSSILVVALGFVHGSKAVHCNRDVGVAVKVRMPGNLQCPMGDLQRFRVSFLFIKCFQLEIELFP